MLQATGTAINTKGALEIQPVSNEIQIFSSAAKKAPRQHAIFVQPKSNPTVLSSRMRMYPKFPMMAMEHRNSVKICALRRRRANRGTDTYVLLEPGKEEVFVTEDELREILKGWLNNWPGGGQALPLDIARFDNTDDAVSYLVTSVCELEIDGNVGSLQWYQVRLE